MNRSAGFLQPVIFQMYTPLTHLYEFRKDISKCWFFVFGFSLTFSPSTFCEASLFPTHSMFILHNIQKIYTIFFLAHAFIMEQQTGNIHFFTHTHTHQNTNTGRSICIAHLRNARECIMAVTETNFGFYIVFYLFLRLLSQSCRERERVQYDVLGAAFS